MFGVLGSFGPFRMQTMTIRHRLSALVAVLTLAGCAPPTPEQQFLNDAYAALGGRSRIEAARHLTIEATGVNYNLGQDLIPDAATQTFEITDYQRVIDIANSRQRVEQVRTPKFAYFQGPQPQKQIQGFDGEAAFNIGATGSVTRLAGRAAADRRADLYHHPLQLLRATLDPATTIANVRATGAIRQADITLQGGPVLTLAVDTAGTPLSISSRTYHANLGDVVVTTALSDYQDVSGLKLPAGFEGKVDAFTTWELQASRQSLDGDVGDLSIPAGAPAAAAPAAPTVTAEPIGQGVWFLAGQSHHSVLVEFSDHLMLIEAPQSEARTQAVIAKARQTVPAKPLTQLVITHHHFDHTAGLRAAIAEGLTVITHSGNRAWVADMARRPHTLQPDALAVTPKPVTVEGVDGQLEFRDATMALTLYHVAANPHSDTMLMAHFPRQAILVEVDAFSPGGQYHPYAANLLENIQSRKLAVDRIVPLHGAVATMADLAKAAGQ